MRNSLTRFLARGLKAVPLLLVVCSGCARKANDASDVEVEVVRGNLAFGSFQPVPLPGPAPSPLSLNFNTQMQLLTDGTVIVNDGAQQTNWWRLTPDNNGKYESGSWKQIASSHFARAVGVSVVLPDGRYLIGGGEYLAGVDPSYVDIYDSALDTWTLSQPMPKPIGDTASSILPNGQFYCSSLSGPETFFFNPTTNAWTAGPKIGTGGNGDEKGWLLMQTGKILDMFDVYSVFDPGKGTWSPARQALGVSLITSAAAGSTEIGPLLQLYSGKVLQLGAAGHKDATGKFISDTGATGIYDPVADTWTRGPDAPTGLQWGDTSATVLINGHVLHAPSDQITAGGNAPNLFEQDFSPGGSFLAVDSTTTNQLFMFLQLPNGQVLVADSAHGLRTYTPSGLQQGAVASARPTITSISAPSAGVFTLNGTQLNGLTTGSMFGDDRNNATNFPIVFLTDTAGHRFYARSFGFNQMAPLPGAAGSCKFTLPVGLPNGTYQVQVSANGIESSNKVPLTVSGTHVVSFASFSGKSPPPNESFSWVVTISQPAPAGGTLVNLTSDDSRVVTVPASVTIQTGNTSTFATVTGRGFGRAHITATIASNSQFIPASSVFGWDVNSVFEHQGANVDTSFIGPTATTSTWTVNITPPAPSDVGVTVTLASSPGTAASTPTSVVIPPNSPSATFTVSRGSTPTGGLGTITASLLNSSKSNWIETYNPVFTEALTPGF
jgi:hypothetical protein